MRVRYLVLALVTIAAGLIVHFSGGFLPPALRDIVGDALWAMMIVWWVSVLVPRLPLLARGGIALAICAAVEFSQIHHAPWLDALRATLPGELILGSDYDPRDLLAYAVGVLVAMVVASASVEPHSSE